MNKNKSVELNEMFSAGTIVKLPRNRRKGKSIDEFVDNTIGKPGSKGRELFELELKMEVLQELIKDVRRKRNLSQEQLGKLVGVKKAQISKLEKGYANTSITTISKVFEALNAKIKISIEIEGEKMELV